MPRKTDDIDHLRPRIICIVRDYGRFDRREAPQYYPDVEGHEANHPLPGRRTATTQQRHASARSENPHRDEGGAAAVEPTWEVGFGVAADQIDPDYWRLVRMTLLSRQLIAAAPDWHPPEAVGLPVCSVRPAGV